VISKAAAERADVQHLVYVAAMMVDGGDVYLERMSSFPASAPINAGVELTADGNFVVTSETAIECFTTSAKRAMRRRGQADFGRRRPRAWPCRRVPNHGD
jgi:hypothetical protein